MSKYNNVIGGLNAEVQERQEKQAVSLQLDYAQKLRNFMREESESYINIEKLTTILSGLRDELQRFIQPATCCIISLALLQY